ncbi:MAG: uroporphyrinogen-III synthase, partial [Betaproteobacteria bacterium]|nr:uroporphyrinogen-III synthase [Betaproteobacteria bacterium]
MPSPGHTSQPASNGLRLLLTRPQDQAAEMATRLAALGIETITLPVLEIIGVAPDLSECEWVKADAFIFVSANAVRYGLPYIPSGCRQKTPCFAIGRATAAALQAGGVTHITTPAEGNDSEALLALPSLQDIAGQHITLVRGHSEAGGRRVLAQALQDRSAVVTPLICYHRRPRQWSDDERETVRQQLQTQQIHGIFAASVETLESLMTNL